MMRSLHLQRFLYEGRERVRITVPQHDSYFRKVDQMNSIALLTSFLTLSILTPLVALGAVNCEPKDAQLSTVQRIAHIKQCLAEAGSPANVKRVAEQQKRMSCEQNAKNKALQGAAKADYVARCLDQNDAKDAAEAMAAGQKNAAPASLGRDYSANEAAAGGR